MTLITRSTRLALIALAALFLYGDHGSAQSAGGGRASMDAALSGGVALDSRPRVIVRHRDGAAARLRRRFVDHGDRITREYADSQALAVEVHRNDLRSLAADPDVLGLWLDSRIRAQAEKHDDKHGTFTFADAQPLRAWL